MDAHQADDPRGSKPLVNHLRTRVARCFAAVPRILWVGVLLGCLAAVTVPLVIRHQQRTCIRQLGDYAGAARAVDSLKMEMLNRHLPHFSKDFSTDEVFIGLNAIKYLVNPYYGWAGTDKKCQVVVRASDPRRDSCVSLQSCALKGEHPQGKVSRYYLQESLLGCMVDGAPTVVFQVADAKNGKTIDWNSYPYQNTCYVGSILAFVDSSVKYGGILSEVSFECAFRIPCAVACNDITENSPLIEPCRTGNVDTVRRLLDEGVRFNVVTKQGSTTPLVVASENGHTAIVGLILDKGKTIGVKNWYCYPTAIEVAAARGHLEVVKLLLVNTTSSDSATDGRDAALRCALQAGYTEIVDLLRRNGADPSIRHPCVTPLMERCVRGDVAQVTDLLDAGEAPNAKTRFGWTSLMLASRAGKLHVVRLLVDRGADVNARHSTRGVTALLLAAEGAHWDVVRLLLGSGAEVNAADSQGRTALMWASEQGRLDCVKELFESGAEVNPRTRGARSALMGSTQNGHADILRVLLEKGALTNLKDRDSRTALMFACTRNDLALVRPLLEAGADVNATDDRGLSVLELAEKAGNGDIILLLRAKAAK